jgi:hypothetical protein
MGAYRTAPRPRESDTDSLARPLLSKRLSPVLRLLCERIGVYLSSAAFQARCKHYQSRPPCQHLTPLLML